MEPKIYRFDFDETLSMGDVEATLHLAILAAEGLFGESTVRMDASYSIDDEHRICIVDARNEVGRSISRVFTGYLGREFGETSFNVRAVPQRRAAAVPPPT